jgi:hypothetical protein
MVPNLKLSVDLDYDLVDPSLYRQLIGYLMYLVKLGLIYVFSEYFEPVHG